MRILIADDNEDSLEMLHAVLEGFGHEVEAVRDGQEALERLRLQPPDLIISDIMMPRMDGFALCRAVKREPELREIPFVFYTATYVDSADQKLAMSLGAARYLLKPLEPERFKSVIAEVVPPRPEEGKDGQVGTVELDQMYAAALARKLEKKVRELELERAEAERKEVWLRSLLSIAPCAILCLDSHGRILQINRQAEQLFSTDDGDPTGRICHELFGGPPGVSPEECLKLVAQQVPVNGLETRIATPRGERIVSWSLASLNNPGGEVGILAVGHDMTDFYRAEEEGGLLREQLNQFKRLESLGRLAAGVAHDFNNLLTPIMGFSEMTLRKAEGMPELANPLKMILQAASRARDLTGQLLSFSRKQVLEKRELDLGGVLVDFQNLLKRLVPASIDVSVSVARGLGKVLADRSQMEQILLNLAVNAADAMPAGGILSFTLSRGEDAPPFRSAKLSGSPEEYLLLSVADTGCGIRPENMERIFDPFFTTKSADKGTGLGLATVYGIVKQHDGAIVTESSPGKGTVFRVFLPSVPGIGQVAEQTRGEETAIVAAGGTILLVEDNPMVREAGALMLEEAGFRVLEAAEGEEALRLAAAESGTIDLLLTDLILPGFDGYQLYRRLVAERPGMKVLFMSGYADGEALEPVLREFRSCFMLKPFTYHDLMKAIGESLGGRIA